MHLAAEHGHFALITLLMEHGGDATALDGHRCASTNFTLTPILAAMSGPMPLNLGSEFQMALVGDQCASQPRPCSSCSWVSSPCSQLHITQPRKGWRHAVCPNNLYRISASCSIRVTSQLDLCTPHRRPDPCPSADPGPDAILPQPDATRPTQSRF